MHRAYLDHNATSPLRPEVRARLDELHGEALGNPSSLHASGRRARFLLDEARERVAAALGAHEDEIVFTSGGTEANGLALFGALQARGPRAGLVTTTAEHSSVLEPAARLADDGRPVARVPVDAACLPDLDALAEACAAPDCALVSLAAANNEVGSVPDLGAVARAVRNARRNADAPLLHLDAAQALGRLPVDLARWPADLAGFSAHKLGGPPGVGVLYKRKGVTLEPRQLGGGQEGGLRAGTENVPAVAAAALAIELAVREQVDLAERWTALAASLWGQVESTLPGCRLLGPPLGSERRLPNTLNVLLPGTDGKVLVTQLDLEGLEASAGSACASGSNEPSHVLRAMGLDEDAARSGLRMSFGWSTSERDVARAVEILQKIFSGRAQGECSAEDRAQPGKRLLNRR